MAQNLSTEILKLYESIVACSNTSAHCPNTINDKTAGIPPRGFYTESKAGTVQILIVGKNPGHILDGESELYRDKSPEEIAKEHLRWGARCFHDYTSFDANGRRSLTFHKNILSYFSYFLDVPKEQVFEHCALTDIVKCQTQGEQDRLQPVTIQECFKKHFLRELAVLQPKVIVALGNEAYDYLNQESLKLLHMLPLVKIKHPSYHYRKDLRESVLASLKQEIQTAFGRK